MTAMTASSSIKVKPERGAIRGKERLVTLFRFTNAKQQIARTAVLQKVVLSLNRSETFAPVIPLQ